MRFRFCILTLLGDLLGGGELRFVQATHTLEDAKLGIEDLSERQPGQYIIYEEETDERVSIGRGV
jgi:hypothetical protein